MCKRGAGIESKTQTLFIKLQSIVHLQDFCTCVYHLNPTCSSFWSLADDFPMITYNHLVLISMPSAHLDDAE